MKLPSFEVSKTSFLLDLAMNSDWVYSKIGFDVQGMLGNPFEFACSQEFPSFIFAK
jgi:hypothetical protein